MTKKNNKKNEEVTRGKNQTSSININQNSLTKEFFKVPAKEDQENVSVIASSRDIKTLRELGEFLDRNLSYFLRGAVKLFTRSYAAPKLEQIKKSAASKEATIDLEKEVF